jgi:hypothetical protein
MAQALTKRTQTMLNLGHPFMDGQHNYITQHTDFQRIYALLGSAFFSQ